MQTLALQRLGGGDLAGPVNGGDAVEEVIVSRQRPLRARAVLMEGVLLALLEVLAEVRFEVVDEHRLGRSGLTYIVV